MAFRSTPTAVLATAIFAIGGLSQNVELKAYKDNQCNNQISPTFQPQETTMTMDTSTDGWPSAKGFLNATFPGAGSNNSAGAIVYWQVPEPGAGCRYVLMQDWPANGDYGDVGVPQGYGMTVLDVGAQGCYYSSFPEGNPDFFWSFCCGGDCSNYAANNTNLISKRGEEDVSVELPRSVDEPEETPVEARSGSPASRARAAVEREASRTSELEARSSSFDWSKCTVVSKQGPRVSSGQQVMVGSPQNCPASQSTGCSFSAVKGTMQATTLTTERTQTITNTLGLSVSFTAELDLLIEKDSVTVGAAWDISDAVAHSTSQSITNTSIFTFTNQITQYPGTNGFVTWIPSYECYSTVVNCGKADSQPLDLCTSGDDQGTYQLVVTN